MWDPSIICPGGPFWRTKLHISKVIGSSCLLLLSCPPSRICRHTHSPASLPMKSVTQVARPRGPYLVLICLVLVSFILQVLSKLSLRLLKINNIKKISVEALQNINLCLLAICFCANLRIKLFWGSLFSEEFLEITID